MSCSVHSDLSDQTTGWTTASQGTDGSKLTKTTFASTRSTRTSIFTTATSSAKSFWRRTSTRLSSVSAKKTLSSASSSSGATSMRTPSLDDDALVDDDVCVHDQCEALSELIVRLEENLESEQLTILPPGTAMVVLEKGEWRCIKMRVMPGIEDSPLANVEGWINSRTSSNWPLITRCSDDALFASADFDVGGRHEVKSTVAVREMERLDSRLVDELVAGTIVRIRELGATNRRRVKVITQTSVEGWISCVTRTGEPLLGKIGSGSPVRSREGGRDEGGKALQVRSEFFRAAQEGDIFAIRNLFERKGMFSKVTVNRSMDLNEADLRGKTLLCYAAAFGHKDIVEYLLNRRANVAAVDDTQKSALHHAARRGSVPEDLQLAASSSDFSPIVVDVYAEIVSILLSFGADIDGHDHHGCSPLMFAVANNRICVTRGLLQAQADVNVKDHEGHRPLDYAMHFGHSELENLLRQAGGLQGGIPIAAGRPVSSSTEGALSVGSSWRPKINPMVTPLSPEYRQMSPGRLRHLRLPCRLLEMPGEGYEGHEGEKVSDQSSDGSKATRTTAQTNKSQLQDSSMLEAAMMLNQTTDASVMSLRKGSLSVCLTGNAAAGKKIPKRVKLNKKGKTRLKPEMVKEAPSDELLECCDEDTADFDERGSSGFCAEEKIPWELLYESPEASPQASPVPRAPEQMRRQVSADAMQAQASASPQGSPHSTPEQSMRRIVSCDAVQIDCCSPASASTFAASAASPLPTPPTLSAAAARPLNLDAAGAARPAAKLRARSERAPVSGDAEGQKRRPSMHSKGSAASKGSGLRASSQKIRISVKDPEAHVTKAGSPGSHHFDV